MLLQLSYSDRGGVSAFRIQGLSFCRVSLLGCSDQLVLGSVLWKEIYNDPEYSLREGMRFV